MYIRTLYRPTCIFILKSTGLKEIGMIFYTLREDDSEQYAKARDVKDVINGGGRYHKGGDSLVQSVAGVRESQQWGHHHGRGHRRQGKPGNQKGVKVFINVTQSKNSLHVLYRLLTF